MDLTIVQKRALNKITNEWRSSYELQESLATLGKLVDLKLILKKEGAGAFSQPRTGILFKAFN